MSSTAIVWLRRDLRLADNPALFKALKQHQKILAVYIHQPEEEAPWQPGAATRWWLHHSLTSLQNRFAALGGQLTILTGNSEQNLLTLCQKVQATHVYWNRLYDPALIERDSIIKRSLKAAGIEATSSDSYLLREPWEALNQQDKPYRVYTPFSRNYFKLAPIESSLSCPKTLKQRTITHASTPIESLGLLPKLHWDKDFYAHWAPGEAAAMARLEDFSESAIWQYHTNRDIPAVDGISRLSPHLHFGEISPRQIWHTVQQQAISQRSEEAALPYLRQIIWRDFAHHLLYHFPHTPEKPFLPMFDAFPWQQNDSFLQQWQSGTTGIPLVDAAMRELWQTGWMHNRARMLVASLLTKNGLVHWREGADWFWDTLVDANLANNTMGWQWTSGCGVDAAPYFRIFSPIRQGQRFDPEGAYVKQWIPELSKMPARFIHEPWNASQAILTEAGIDKESPYANAGMDLSATRQTALALYKQMRAPS